MPEAERAGQQSNESPEGLRVGTQVTQARKVLAGWAESGGVVRCAGRLRVEEERVAGRVASGARTSNRAVAPPARGLGSPPVALPSRRPRVPFAFPSRAASLRLLRISPTRLAE